jgi:plasmid stability protein
MITITIKGIPKETHHELKRRATAHRRSLNSEVISVLESCVRSVPVDTKALLARVRTRREAMKFKTTAAEINRIIREGRDSH